MDATPVTVDRTRIKKLADQHEVDVAELLGGRKTKSSGNQWNDPADGRTDRRDVEFAFAWDCKAAMPETKSVSVTREMLNKIIEQAGGERPAIPLRFYDTWRGEVDHDWVVIRLDDLAEMTERLNGTGS